MIVRVKSKVSAVDRAAAAGAERPRAVEFHVSADRLYPVLGVNGLYKSISWGREIMYDIVDDEGRLTSLPSHMIEIVDGHISSAWMFREISGGFVLWPEEFFVEYFHDDLSEGDAASVATFNRVRQRIATESAAQA